MNFLLNKIDTDLRRQVHEKTMDGKVHRKEDTKIYKDSEKNKGRSFEELVKDNKKKGDKIIVQADKDLSEVISVKAEREEELRQLLNGQHLDVRK